jgi:hypothetical protein
MMSPQTVHCLDEGGISYLLARERAEKKAEGLSTDYLRGYLDHYESGRGPIKRFFTKMYDALDLASEPAEVVGFRKALESRVKTEAK